MATGTVFSSASVVDGQNVVMSYNLDTLIGLTNYDPYFDSTSKLARVDTHFDHQDGRQTKRIVLLGPDFSSSMSWSSYTHDGTWQKNEIKVYDWENAILSIPRSTIGSSGDLTHSDGTMTLINN
jgi:hypothetical protein